MKHAIISVWNKTGVCDLAKSLVNDGYRILSTGGTYNTIRDSFTAENQKNLIQVSNFTGYPEILGGRVKTLHPKIHAGILARDDQSVELEGRGLARISVVVANLYPFTQTVQCGAIENAVLENIDIGGHTLIRAAAKNYKNTIILTDPADYSLVMRGCAPAGERAFGSIREADDAGLGTSGFAARSKSLADRGEAAKVLSNIFNLTVKDRRTFAQKAFSHAAEYDISIARYFGDQTVRKYYPIQQLKYGCNPHQNHATLCGINTNDIPLQVLNGNVGYINLMDALLGYQLVCEASTTFGAPVAASYKHTSPAGVGLGRQLSYLETEVFDVFDRELTPMATALTRARNCDPLSSFGDFLSVSHPVDLCTAKLIKREVSDGIIAPSYDRDALEILKEKKGGKYIILQLSKNWKGAEGVEYREIGGMALAQEPNNVQTLDTDLLNIPTAEKYIPDYIKEDLILANITLKYTQSNSVAYAQSSQVIGICAGQQNRVDCVKLAGEKAARWCARFTEDAQREHLRIKRQIPKRTDQTNALYAYLNSKTSPISPHVQLSLASDAFFPFPDSIEVANSHHVKYIIQPGGSLGDDACIAACDKHNIMMAMTGKRMFLH
uniref:AICARFT/IMPCHase bienzyme n=1 Tax=Marseillevirus LCMAC201 TaxID=2506605 RepID=A0A481YXC7_9VIRU|nr:MAG: AICARFT/IMPCHase bienzyme [Marseillevirus LCMAC201]